MGKIGEGKNYFCFSFSSVYDFKQTEEDTFLQAQSLKMLNKKMCLLLFVLQAKFSKALHTKSRQL